MKRLIIFFSLLICRVNIYSQTEMINNGAFLNSSGWSFGTGWSVNSGKASFNATAIGTLSQSNADMVSSIKPNTTYTISFDLVSPGSSFFAIMSTSIQIYVPSATRVTGTYSMEFTTPSNIGNGGLVFYAYTDAAFTIDNISLKVGKIIGKSPYYVATSGSDINSGDIDHPWATWQKAFSTAKAGDTVYFRGGVYYPTVYSSGTKSAIVHHPTASIGHSGTKANPICFFAYPADYAAGNFPILDCKYLNPGNTGINSSNNGILLYDSDWLKLKGLTIRNVYQRYNYVNTTGIAAIGCYNMSLENITVHNIGGPGIRYITEFAAYRPEITEDSTYFINCDVYNVCDSLCNESSSCGGSTIGGLADGIKYGNGNTWGAYVLFDGCRVWHYSDNGIDVNSAVKAVFRNCWIWRGGDYGSPVIGEGSAFKFGALTADINVPSRIITNCIAAYNKFLGWDENNTREDYSVIHGGVYNCTSYRNYIGFGNFSWTDGREIATEYKNNISYKDIRYARGDEEHTGIIEDHNSWVTGNYDIPNAERIPLTDNDFVSLDSSQLSLPRKSDGSLPDITFLHLSPTSDAINAGTDLGLPYYGSAPDLGAFENWGTDPSIILLTSIIVNGAGGTSTITTDNGTLQLSATVLPSNATNKTLTWSISSGKDKASVSSTGLVMALNNGTAVIRATANDGSGVYGTLTITIINQVIPVTGITVTGQGGATTITTDNGTLQLSATVLPSDATNKTFTWSILSGTDKASISSTGLLTALDNGTAVAVATANDGSGVYSTLTITILNQVIPVTGITVTGAGGAASISTDNGTLQLSALVLPANATTKTVTWSISSGTDKATISSTGLLTALDNGTAVARATANDGSGVYGTLTITINNQVIPVTGITVTGSGGTTTIASDNGTLQLSAAVLPLNATNQTVTWSISSGTDKATISSTGLVTALDNGTAVARATANDGSGVYSTLTITILNQVIPVTGITVTGAGGAASISTDNGTLQLSALILPANATTKTVTWSISSGTDKATISSTGLVTALDNGTAIARATANDGSGIYGILAITITNQVIPVTGITVTGTGGVTLITSIGGTLQLNSLVLPSNATNQTVTWSISSGADKASISSTGIMTAIDNGTAVAMATANDGTGIYGTLTITITNQTIPVTGITVTGAGGAIAIITDNSTLQLSATVSPSNATIKTVTWSIYSGIDKASISSTGLVTALDNGTIVARATANDGTGLYGTLTITILNQVIPVSGITVTGAGGVTAIFTDNGTLQLSTAVSPSNATIKTVTWSISSGIDKASISSTGLVTALDNGTIVARATANDGTGLYGTLTITISNQIIPVTGIKVTGAGGSKSIKTNKGHLKLSATVSPSNATITTVTWSISSQTKGTNVASIDSTGLVTALDNGTAVARATANDGSGVYDTLTVTITNQIILVVGITVTGQGGATMISMDNGTLQLSTTASPSNATNQAVTWSILSGIDRASISSTGLVTAINNGTVVALATANDGSGVYGTLAIMISNQIIPVSPVYVNSVIESTSPTQLIITYDSQLGNIIPGTSAFIVLVNSIARNVTNVSISGVNVLLTISSPILYNDNVSITYIKPELNPLQSVSGGLAANISNQPVINRINPEIPTLTGASVANTTPALLDMTYNLSLANNSVPAASSFIVLVNSSQIGVNTITISDKKVQLALASSVFNGDVVTVSYMKPANNPIKTVSGGEALSFNDQAVINYVTTIYTPPVVMVDYAKKSYSGFVAEINASPGNSTNGESLSYEWIISDDIPVSSKNSSRIKYLAPVVDKSRKVVFTLNVKDSKSLESKTIEVEILPYKPELEAAEISNIEASSFQEPYNPYNIIDGNIGTLWAANGINESLLIELKESFMVDHVKLAFQPGQNRESYFDIFGSEDTVNWEPILNKSVSCDFSGALQVFPFPPSKATKEYKYVKIIGLGNSIDTWNYISELKIFGYQNNQTLAYEKLQVKIYPNPASDHITIRIDDSKLSPDLVQLVDLSGKIILQEKLDPDLNEFTIPINIKKGAYIIQLSSNKLTLFTQKLIIIN